MIEFKDCIYLANTLYGIEDNPVDLEEIGLIAWGKINSKILKIYKYSTNIDCSTMTVELPCNFEKLISVTASYEDWQYTTNHTDYGNLSSTINEAYVERLKSDRDILYNSGKFVKFERLGDTLYFEENYGKLYICYYGSWLDDEGLPYITEKQSLAIACYIAFTKMYKEGIMTRNGNTINIANALRADWNKLCAAARVSDHISQNEMNEILDVRTSWNRKLFGKSLKPIR